MNRGDKPPVARLLPIICREAAERLVEVVWTQTGARADSLAVAVVDPGGNLVHFSRGDAASFAAGSAAIDKAFAAVAWSMPTKDWTRLTEPGAAGWGVQTLLGGRSVVVAGGIPLVESGRLVGGLGVSGGLPDEDHDVALGAARSLELAP